MKNRYGAFRVLFLLSLFASSIFCMVPAGARAGVVIAGIPAATNTPPPGMSPMQLQSCIIHPASAVNTAEIAVGTAAILHSVRSPFLQDLTIAGGIVAGVSSTRPYLSVRMTNESDRTISMVQIYVRSADGSTGFVRDVGTFSPGITIHHVFFSGAGTTGANGLFSQPSGLTCSVKMIAYRHGGSWFAP